MFSNLGIPQFAAKEQTIQKIVDGAAEAFGVDSRIIMAIIATESSFDLMAKRYESRLGESSLGLMQILPSTAKSVTGKTYTEAQLLDPYTNIMAGTQYYAQQMKKYNHPVDAYAAYNAGAVYRDKNYAYVNQSNVNNFIGWLNKYTGSSYMTAITKETRLALNIGGILVVGVVLAAVAYWPPSKRTSMQLA